MKEKAIMLCLGEYKVLGPFYSTEQTNYVICDLVESLATSTYQEIPKLWN